MSPASITSLQPVVLPYRTEDAPHQIILSFTGSFAWLSNFASCSVTLPADVAHNLPTLDYKATENAYMAAKVLNLELRQKLQNLSPKEAKQLSNTPAFEAQHRADYSNPWRLQIMLELNRQKYSQRNPELRAQLLATGEATLIEGTTWGDTFFGVCMKKGEGQNYLGRILMQCRDELRAEEGLPALFPSKSLLPEGIV